MGTVFSIDIRDPGEWAGAIAEAVYWLHRVDAVFSTYRSDSDISRIRRGELRVADADPEVGRVLELCARAQLATGGAFTAMPGGRLDPTGLVKGWAIERARRDQPRRERRWRPAARRRGRPAPAVDRGHL
jgi:thiamine biosynthesis lipoprotein